MSVQVAVGVFEGRVVAKWPEAISEITFDPQNAYTVGMALAKAAMDAHRGHGSEGDIEFLKGELKIKVTEERRDLLVATVATILRTFIDQGKSPGYCALHCVDAVLRETAR